MGGSLLLLAKYVDGERKNACECPFLEIHILRRREQPIFTTRAHVFQIDPSTKKNWVPASKQAVTVSYFYDSTRNSYRIISVDGAKVIINSTITPNMTFTKTSQKFGQWADSRANTVFGLGFPSEQQLTKDSLTLLSPLPTLCLKKVSRHYSYIAAAKSKEVRINGVPGCDEEAGLML
ncbi:hypothetical protein QYF61_001919 [Mycteria americana]|uniref:WH1 domain-containing protein n=1 Tax=Mycteria americana TaxID=33587 RepID=A0AAN7P2X9_MYCAM|nr:hypothetical protein QYF61_001919 [Mycteria americana]